MIDKDGRITHYQKVRMDEVRQIDDLSAAAIAEIALQQRATEFGEGSASR
ncbi:MAG: hypothetical protein JO353_11040 [Phycisphaerae bacterium]|nr:hypothetical protein [Phycisphaerae bacterium]